MKKLITATLITTALLTTTTTAQANVSMPATVSITKTKLLAYRVNTLSMGSLAKNHTKALNCVLLPDGTIDRADCDAQGATEPGLIRISQSEPNTSILVSALPATATDLTLTPYFGDGVTQGVNSYTATTANDGTLDIYVTGQLRIEPTAVSTANQNFTLDVSITYN